MPDAHLPFTFAGPVLTKRLVLRMMSTEDVDDVHVYRSLPEVCRYLPFEPRSRDEVAEKVAEYAEAHTLSGDGDYWELAIERASDPGRVIGDLFFALRSRANARAEIGWTLHPDFAGQGYASEAARALLGLAFGSLGLHRVFAQLDPRNHASAALCTRLGMRKEAHFVADLWLKGEWGDTVIYGLLAQEWDGDRPD